VDTLGKVPADTEDSAVDVTMDADEVDDGVEDEVHLHRRRRTTTYLRSVDRLPHSLVEEEEHSMPRTLLNVSIIGTIVSHAALTLKMGIHLQHAHKIGENLVTRKGATGIMYSSTLRLDMLHLSRDSIRTNCLRRSDR
jgi:hypothetical protein